ncbi:MAG: hypothetical protein ACOC44_06240 [Promethearchaeia archaeon]
MSLPVNEIPEKFEKQIQSKMVKNILNAHIRKASGEDLKGIRNDIMDVSLELFQVTQCKGVKV